MSVCDECKHESRIIALEKDQERNSNQHKEFYQMLKETEVEQARSEVILEQILSSIRELRNDVAQLTNKDGEAWHGIKRKVMDVAVAVFFTAVFAGVLKIAVVG